jgi:adenylate cyclase
MMIAQGWADDSAHANQEASRLAAAALSIDATDAMALAARGYAAAYVDHDFEGGRQFLDQAVATSPSFALAWCFGAAVRCWLEQAEEAIRWAERALRLAPNDPFAFVFQHVLAQAHFTASEMDQAAAWARSADTLNPRHSANLRLLAATHAALGRHRLARDAAERLLVVEPRFTLSGFAARTPLRGDARDRFLLLLREAGLTD